MKEIQKKSILTKLYTAALVLFTLLVLLDTFSDSEQENLMIRTLHYYDKIDLLKPCCIEQNGYRKYNENSLKRLQQIMFYKEMDLPLKKIRNIMNH